jgi:purine catabolism regulator
VAAIVIEGKLTGYLSILGSMGSLDELDRLAAERGALVCAVEWAKQRAVETAEQRLRGNFLDMMLTAGATEERVLARRATEMGYELAHQHVVILFGLTENAPQVVSTLAREFRTPLVNAGIRAFLCSYEGDLAALCGAQAVASLKNLEKHARAARERVIHMTPIPRMAVGIGRPGAGLAGLRRSFTQAQEALTLVRDLFEGDRVLSFGDLGLYHLLNRLQGCEELARFYDQTLAPVARYDASRDTQLVQTLETFFAYHGNVSQTAESLHLHRNSLLYRLERIGEITGLDLYDVDDRFSLQLALKLQPLLASSRAQAD